MKNCQSGCNARCHWARNATVADEKLYLNHCVSDDDGTIEAFEIRFPE